MLSTYFSTKIFKLFLPDNDGIDKMLITALKLSVLSGW